MKRDIFLLFLLFLLLPRLSQAAAPVCTSAGTASGDMGSFAVLTIPNVTVASSQGYLALLLGYRDRTVTVSSIARNSESFTSIGSLADADDNLSAHIWRLKNPSTGTHDLTITLSGTFSGAAAAGVLLCTGVDQTTSEGTAASAQADDFTTTATVTSAVGELVISVAAKNDGGTSPPTLTADGGETQVFNVTSTVGNGFDVVVAGSYEAGAASVDMQWGGSAGPIDVVGISLKPAAAAAIARRREIIWLP